MTKNNDPKKESLAEIAVDPDVLARELALDFEIDPLEQIDEDLFSKGLNITQECNEALKMLKGNKRGRDLLSLYSQNILKPCILSSLLPFNIFKASLHS